MAQRWVGCGAVSIACAASGCARSPAPVPPASPVAIAPAHPEPAQARIPAWIRSELGARALPTAGNVAELEASELERVPNVVVTKSSVLLDGERVASVWEIARRQRLTRVDGLFDRLKARSDDYRKAHPGAPSDGRIYYWVDAHASALVVKSVFQTAAFAGYPHAAFVVRRRGGPGSLGRLDVDARIPGPPAHGGEAVASAEPVRGGRLAPEVIQGVVRWNYGFFRKCYETGLARSPTLAGRVIVRFVIDRAGNVSNAEDSGSTLADPEVIRCILDAYGQIKFPAPEGGIVTVVYPIQFSPGDPAPDADRPDAAGAIPR